MVDITNMSLDDLRAMIEQIVDERLAAQKEQHDERSVQAVIAEMQAIRVEPVPGMPSVADMVREDRDR